jgi:hypothetical protein
MSAVYVICHTHRAGFTKLHKPVHFAETLNLAKRWMADSSPDYRGAEYTLVRFPTPDRAKCQLD